MSAEMLMLVFLAAYFSIWILKATFLRPKPPAYKLIAAQKELARLREGSQSRELIEIDDALKAGWSLSDIGTTGEELVAFRYGKSQRIYAERMLARYRSGEAVKISSLIAYMQRENILPEDIGTSKQELDGDLREEVRRSLLERIDLLRSDVDHYVDPDRVCAEIVEGDKFGISLEELGTTKEKLVSMQKRAWLNQARLWWNRCKQGVEGGTAFEGLDFTVLSRNLSKAGAKIADLGISAADLVALRRKNYLNLAMATLEVLRQRIWFLPISGHYTHMGKDLVLPGDPEPYVRKLQGQLAKAKATLESVGSSQEEIDSLMPPAYMYSATFLLYWTRKLSERRALVEHPRPLDKEMSRNVAAIRTFLEKVGKKPEDIKTSEEELQSLDRLSVVAS